MIRDYRLIDNKIYDLNEVIAAIKLLISNQEILLSEIKLLKSKVNSLRNNYDNFIDD